MLNEIRKLMKNHNMDYFLFKDSDPHMSEYVCDYYRQRTKVSGFTGSNGTLIVGLEDAFLFTDGRYYIQAEKELDGTGIKLMKMGERNCPSVKDFISEITSSGKKIYTNDSLISYKDYLNYGFFDKDFSKDIFYDAYENKYHQKYPELNADTDVCVLDIELTGESVSGKIKRIRDKMDVTKTDVFVSSDLAVNMWIYNIRGNAVPNNPVAFCHSAVTKDGAYLFIKDKEKLSAIDSSVVVRDYDEILDFIDECKDYTTFTFDYSKTPASLAKRIKNKKGSIIKNGDCQTSLMKCIKNDTEINNIRKYYSKDNKIVKEFLEFVKSNDLSGMNEYDLSQKLDGMRLSDEDCFDLSFDTISAFGSNAAMMHYEATQEKNIEIGKDNLYLVDSGGQWRGATTDITRTVAIGNPSYKMKHDYTRVLRGLLHLQNATFMEGVTGINLDILARLPMWEEGDDYKCGTGHGIGYRLCVHEGPNNIRWRQSLDDVVLRTGMIMSDEPGIYREGEYGIRLENVILVKEKCVTKDGRFLCFECLTYVPFDEDLILRNEMSPQELEWLDDYMRKC